MFREIRLKTQIFRTISKLDYYYYYFMIYIAPISRIESEALTSYCGGLA